MTKNKGLGRGLSVLLGEDFNSNHNNDTATFLTNNEKNNNSTMKNIFRELSLSSIQVSEQQPWKNFDNNTIAELANSIKERGILQPIIVRPVAASSGSNISSSGSNDSNSDSHDGNSDSHDGNSDSHDGNSDSHDSNKFEMFEIIAGERRYRAASLAGMEFIPAIVRNMNDQETAEIALIENIQRENLNPIDEAQAYERLIKQYNYTHEELGKTIGKSRSYITNSIRLLSLSGELKDHVNQGKISVTHARRLVKNKDAEGLAEKIITQNLSTRQTENLVSNFKNKSYSDDEESNKIGRSGFAGVKSPDEVNEVFEIEQAISKEFGTRVEIKLGKYHNGQIVIHFRDLEKFDAIIQKLGS